MNSFLSKEKFESYDDCFYSDSEPIDPDTEFEEFLEKTKENLHRLSPRSKSDSEAKATEDGSSRKYTLFSNHLKPNTNKPCDDYKTFVSDLKDSLPSPVQNVDNHDNLSSSLLNVDVIKSTNNEGNDDGDNDFSKFLSKLKNNFQTKNETIPTFSDGSPNSNESTPTEDSKIEHSKEIKTNLRTKSSSTDESSNSSKDTSTDDSEGENFESFISALKNTLQSNSKSKDDSRFPLSLKPLNKQRSHSLADEGSSNQVDSVSKRSQSVSSNTVFDLKSVEAEAKHDFMMKRKVYAIQLYKFFNQIVFNNKLPEDMLLKWSGYLKSTAGKTFCRRKSEQYSCHIELSSDVLISFDRLRDTLLHEMCHAACWLVNHSHDKHGPLWKTWASRCNLILPQIEVPSRCHQYELSYSYILKCVSCDFVRKRHKMCPKLDRKICPKCRSSTVLTKA